MIDNETKSKILTKLIGSREFADSRVLKDLLVYLVEASQRDEIPKEITIATECFKREADFDPSNDAYVRSNVYKLRRKLEDYYEEEGKKDKIRIHIPKGHYHVEFDHIQCLLAITNML